MVLNESTEVIVKDVNDLHSNGIGYEAAQSAFLGNRIDSVKQNKQ